jgi:hypothetical protein
MAKRKGAAKKAARTSGRGGARKTTRAAGRSGGGKRAVKASARKASAARKGARKSVARPAAGRKATAKKTPARRTGASSTGRGGSSSAGRGAAAPKSSTTGRGAGARKDAAAALPPRTVATRKAPGLDRERRTIRDDIEASVPSSLDLDRKASAARSGRRELREKFNEHTETSPALTGGDIDADWESADSVGDEAPGGDNPTPDQDIVDDIGRAVGNEYQDNEELKGADKITKRDKHRWELDPASSEDYDDRD